MRAMWEADVAEARTWNGEDPVRTIDFAASEP